MFLSYRQVMDLIEEYPSFDLFNDPITIHGMEHFANGVDSERGGFVFSLRSTDEEGNGEE